MVGHHYAGHGAKASTWYSNPPRLLIKASLGPVSAFLVPNSENSWTLLSLLRPHTGPYQTYLFLEQLSHQSKLEGVSSVHSLFPNILPFNQSMLWMPLMPSWWMSTVLFFSFSNDHVPLHLFLFNISMLFLLEDTKIPMYHKNGQTGEIQI